MCRATAACYFTGECDGYGSQNEYRGDHRKSVTEADHQCLMFHCITERDDGLLMGRCWVMRHEEIGHLSKPRAHYLAAERHGLADDVRVELLTLSHHGAKHCGPDAPTEISKHVADARRCRRFLRSDIAFCYGSQWGE